MQNELTLSDDLFNGVSLFGKKWATIANYYPFNGKNERMIRGKFSKTKVRNIIIYNRFILSLPVIPI